MKTTAALIALSLFIPAAAQAAPAPGEPPKTECCCKGKEKPMACCEEHARPAKDGHEGHDMAKPQKS